MDKREVAKIEAASAVHAVYLRRVEALLTERDTIYKIMNWMAQSGMEIPKHLHQMKEQNMDERGNLMRDAASIVKTIQGWRADE